MSEKFLDWSVFGRSRLSLGDAAKAYHDAGFDVVANGPKGKGALHYDSVSFAPIPTFPEFWRLNKDANIGLLTGREFWVLDVDGKRGATSLAWLEEVLEHKFTGLSIFSGRGAHLYFKTPKTYLGGLHQIPSTVSLLPGIDVRGVSGQIIAPPSVHANGRHYEVRSGSGPEITPVALFRLVQNAEPIVLKPKHALPPALQCLDAESAARASRGSSGPVQVPTETPSIPTKTPLLYPSLVDDL